MGTEKITQSKKKEENLLLLLTLAGATGTKGNAPVSAHVLNILRKGNFHPSWKYVKLTVN